MERGKFGTDASRCRTVFRDSLDECEQKEERRVRVA